MGIGIICVVAAVGLLVRDGLGAPAGAAVPGARRGTCWAVFWRPVVAVDDGGVRLVNVLRTIDLPWPSILAIDTKWALTLITVVRPVHRLGRTCSRHPRSDPGDEA